MTCEKFTQNVTMWVTSSKKERIFDAISKKIHLLLCTKRKAFIKINLSREVHFNEALQRLLLHSIKLLRSEILGTNLAFVDINSADFVNTSLFIRQ